MSEFIPLAEAGPFTISAYGLFVALGVLLGGLLTCLLWKKETRRKADGALLLLGMTLILALLGARIVYCATMFGTFLSDYDDQGGLLYMLKLWTGGYALYGAVLGGMLAGWLFARRARMHPFQALDLLAPGAAIALCLARLGEYFTYQGYGPDVDNEALWFFPVALPRVGEEDWWVMPVFAWEAIAALAIAVALLLLRHRYHGRRAGNFLVLLGLTQIILDSCRQDEYIRFGFVHFNQLAAAVTIFAVLLLRIRRCLRRGGQRGWQITRLVLFFVCVGVIIAIEFGLDKSNIDNLILYGVMALTLTAMGLTVMLDGQAEQSESPDVPSVAHQLQAGQAHAALHPVQPGNGDAGEGQV